MGGKRESGRDQGFQGTSPESSPFVKVTTLASKKNSGSSPKDARKGIQGPKGMEANNGKTHPHLSQEVLFQIGVGTGGETTWGVRKGDGIAPNGEEKEKHNNPTGNSGNDSVPVGNSNKN